MDPKPSRDEVLTVIRQAIAQVMKDAGRTPPAEIGEQLSFAELKLDSLDLAVVVVKLESDLGVDPFRDGVAPVRNVSDLTNVYAQAIQGG